MNLKKINLKKSDREKIYYAWFVFVIAMVVWYLRTPYPFLEFWSEPVHLFTFFSGSIGLMLTFVMVVSAYRNKREIEKKIPVSAQLVPDSEKKPETTPTETPISTKKRISTQFWETVWFKNLVYGVGVAILIILSIWFAYSNREWIKSNLLYLLAGLVFIFFCIYAQQILAIPSITNRNKQTNLVRLVVVCLVVSLIVNGVNFFFPSFSSAGKIYIENPINPKVKRERDSLEAENTRKDLLLATQKGAVTAREQELQVVKQQEDSVRKKNAEFSRMLAAQNDSILFLKERSVGYADMQKKLVVAETKEDSLVREVTSVNVQLVKAAGEQKKLQQQNSFLGSILDSTKKADSTKFVALQQQLAERNKETGNTTTASVNGLGKGILVVIGISIVITGILIFSWAKFGQTRKKQLLIGLAGSAIIIVLTLTFSWFFFSKEPEVVHAEEQEKQELKDSLAKEYQVKLVDTLKKVAKLPVPVVHASDTALATSLERERVLKESLAAKADSLFAVNKEKNAIIDSLKLVTKRDNIADTTQQRSRSSVVIKGPGRYSIPRNQVVVRSKKRNPGKYSLP